MSQGRYQAGDEVTFLLLCKDALDRPVAPDEFPRVAVYAASGHPVTDRLLPVLERGVATGLFHGRVFLNEDYAEGRYDLVCRWVAAGHHGGEVKAFEVLPGGGATGQVLAMTNYVRPAANYLVNQRSGGSIFRGKNPRR